MSNISYPIANKDAVEAAARANKDAVEAAARYGLRATSANPNFRKYVPRFRETFGDITRWVSTDASLSNDTVNYSAAGVDKRADGTWVQTTGKSMKATKTTTEVRSFTLTNTLTATMNLTGHHFLLRYYAHEGSGNTSYLHLSAIYIYIFDAAGKYGWYHDLALNANSKPGWRTVAFMKCTGQEATFDITQIVKIEIVFYNKDELIAQTPSVTFDFLEFFPKIAAPVPYVVTMDGGYIAQKDAMAYLTARGIRSHNYVTYDKIGTSGFMTIDDLKQAQFMGHFIDTHERFAEPTRWYTMTDAQKAASLEESIKWKMDNGFLEGKGFAPSGGQGYNDADVLNFMYPYLEHLRFCAAWNTSPWNPRLLGISYDTNYLTVAEEAVNRQSAIDNGNFYIGLVHSLVTSFTIADFKTIIDAAIADINIKFVTIPELIETNWYA